MSKAHSVADHHRDWLDCIRTRRRPRADVEIGACSTILAHLGCIALWTGRALRWDPVKEEFVGDREANALRVPGEPGAVERVKVVDGMTVGRWGGTSLSLRRRAWQALSATKDCRLSLRESSASFRGAQGDQCQ